MSKIAAPLGGVIMSNQPSEVGGRGEGTENTQNEKRKRNESVREYQITLDMEMSSWRRRQTGGQAGRLFLAAALVANPPACKWVSCGGEDPLPNLHEKRVFCMTADSEGGPPPPSIHPLAHACMHGKPAA